MSVCLPNNPCARMLPGALAARPQSRPSTLGLTLALALCSAVAARAQVFEERASYEEAANFSTTDLLQGLSPDESGAGYDGARYITDAAAGDAVSATNPGAVTPVMSGAWYEMPAYLVYTLPAASDISEIRVSAALTTGADEPGNSQTAATTYGGISLGCARHTNPGGHPPIRPAENAIEVMFGGDTVWTPIVSGLARSGPRQGTAGFWQGVWTFAPGALTNVQRVKFMLGPVSMWGSYGVIARVAEVDVLGETSAVRAATAWQHVPATDPALQKRGYVFPGKAGGVILEWSASGIEATFTSKTCRLRFKAPANSREVID